MRTWTRRSLLLIALLAFPGIASAGGDTPTRDEVMHGLSAVIDDVARCGDGRGATSIQVRVVFRGRTGAAEEVHVPDTALPQATVDCIRTAVLRAHMPPFRRERFTVSFPFRI